MTLTSPLDKRGEASDDSYNETLRLLSEGSVHKHFDPYLDIDWDSPKAFWTIWSSVFEIPEI